MDGVMDTRLLFKLRTSYTFILWIWTMKMNPRKEKKNQKVTDSVMTPRGETKSSVDKVTCWQSHLLKSVFLSIGGNFSVSVCFEISAMKCSEVGYLCMYKAGGVCTLLIRRNLERWRYCMCMEIPPVCLSSDDWYYYRTLLVTHRHIVAVVCSCSCWQRNSVRRETCTLLQNYTVLYTIQPRICCAFCSTSRPTLFD